MKSMYIGLLATAAMVAANATLAAEPADIYKSACSLCHEASLAGAPKLGDKAAWAPRIQQGRAALYDVALNGKPGTMMIAKGGNSSLSDADIKAVVDYMVVNSQ